jgi:DNA mismatch endonuclease (patch repair protein)
MPKSKVTFWVSKFSSNVARDRRNLKELRSLGWKPVVIWECEARRNAQLNAKLRRILS